MSTNFVSGLISGIDTSALVEATIQSQSGPILLLQKRQADSTARLSAWQSLEAMLVSLKVESDQIGRAALWSGLAATTSNEEFATAIATGDAALGAHVLHVLSLAAAGQVRSQNYASSAADVGAGTLTIGVGSTSTDLTVEAGTTLADLVDLVNEADLGVTAALVNGRDENGDDVVHFVLTGNETGVDAAITVSGTLAGGTSPVFTSIRAAADAHVQYGGAGGLDLYSATNTFKDLVDGLDVTVHKISADDENVTIDVARDAEGLKDAIGTFVDRYNTVLGFIAGQYRFDPEAGTRPPLLGDATLTGIGSRLRSRVTSLVGGTDGAAFRTLFSIGLKSGANGTLSFDEGKFDEAIASDYDAVSDLFRPRARFDAEGVEWISAPDEVDLEGSTFTIEVTEAASKATLVGDIVDFTGGITIDSSNDAFKFSVNGTTSETLHLAQGTYADGAAVAAALQDAIDGSEELDRLGATVTFDVTSGASGRFTFSSEREGDDESLQLLVSSGTFDDALGLSDLVNVRATGTDVAGTINGIEAKGDGTTLSIEDPDSELDGLSFRVEAGVGVVPFTSTATFSEGVGRSLSRQLFSLTDVSTGVLGRVSKTVQGQIDRFEKSIAAKQEMLEERRVRLLARYARLESTLAQLQGQGQFVAAQIGSLSGSSGLGSNS